ncbi:MAG: amino acid adenylation domain-containing protein [Pirellulales bacterium]|nr:amino acid adenylation domain-containing protein [Pirellulales bacterium]
MFLQAAAVYPDRPALHVQGKCQTYAQLRDRVGRVARVLSRQNFPVPRLGAVFGSRTAAVYEGLLGTLVAGAGYVPLNPRFPAARNRFMLETSGATTLVADHHFVEQQDEILSEVERPLCVVLPEVADAGEYRRRFPRHEFFGASDLEAASPLKEAPAVCDDALAYILFTSGSTGAPKGVMVTHRNVMHYVECMSRRYCIGPTDRFSQTFDLTFDVSVSDMFVCWPNGACLCVPTANDMLAPAKFIREQQVTVWFSVPSVGILMKRMNLLKPEAFPSVRWSLFAGEPLPASIAAAWKIAAPDSHVENLYGPTEATITCTVHRFDPADDARDGTVPIGRALPGLSAAIVDEHLQLVPAGEIGELCIAGAQVAAGYWQDPEKTADKFVAMSWHAGPDNRWYRTGDLACVNEQGDILYRGRADEQVKIRGFRVELMEIEHVLKSAAGTEFVAVLAYPRNELGPLGTTAFLSGSTVDPESILAVARERLPNYMVPQELIFLPEMPLNANGKIDKKSLKQHLENA